MESAQNQTTLNWKEMVARLRIYCTSSDILEHCVKNIHNVSADVGTLQDKVSDALNMAKGMRDRAFMELVIELTDLDAGGAGELIQHITQYDSHTNLVNRMAQCSEPPLVKYGFGWCLTVDYAVYEDVPF